MGKGVSIVVLICILILSCSKEPILNNALRIHNIITLQSDGFSYDSIVFLYDNSNNIIATNSWNKSNLRANTEWRYSDNRLDSIVNFGYWGNPSQYGHLSTYYFDYDNSNKLTSVSIKSPWNEFYQTLLSYNYSGKISELNEADGYNKFVYDLDNLATDSAYESYFYNPAELYKTVDLSYDDKINPFFGKYPVLFHKITATTEHAEYLSKNNVTFAKQIYGSEVYTINISYEYNESNYPVKVDRTASTAVGTTHNVYSFNYEPCE